MGAALLLCRFSLAPPQSGYPGRQCDADAYAGKIDQHVHRARAAARDEDLVYFITGRI